MKRKKYYIYAGYYELWISDIKLGRPLTYMGFAYSLENAQLRCEKIDPEVCVCYSESLKDEVGSMFYWIDDLEEAFPFFNEQDYKLDGGIPYLTPVYHFETAEARSKFLEKWVEENYVENGLREDRGTYCRRDAIFMIRDNETKLIATL